MTNLEDNPNIPPLVAHHFVTEMNNQGYVLEMTEQSLETELERLLCDIEENNIEVTLGLLDGLEYDLQTSIACYFGTVLSNKYKGQWKGHCTRQSGANYYTSSILFGEYNLNPYYYPIGYRMANGVKDTGTIAEWLKSKRRYMEDHIDYHKRDIKKKRDAIIHQQNE